MKSSNHQIFNFASRKVSRRKFIQASGALGIAGAVPNLLIGSVAYASPVRGGHLRVATVQGSSTDSLDPIHLTSGHTNFLFSTMHKRIDRSWVGRSIGTIAGRIL